MDDVPGMKAVLSLLMFPNYKPCGTGEGRCKQEDREERAGWAAEQRGMDRDPISSGMVWLDVG